MEEGGGVTCDVPGCPNAATIRIPVGPDAPRMTLDADGEPVFDVRLTDPAPVFVVGNSCQAHVEIVRAALRERYQPRWQRIREGRPL